MPPITRVARFRLFIDDALVDYAQVPIGVGARRILAVLGETHGALCAKAQRRGEAWRIEVEFPDGQHVRWGSDTAAGRSWTTSDLITAALAERFEYYYATSTGGRA